MSCDHWVSWLNTYTLDVCDFGDRGMSVEGGDMFYHLYGGNGVAKPGCDGEMMWNAKAKVIAKIRHQGPVPMFISNTL